MIKQLMSVSCQCALESDMKCAISQLKITKENIGCTFCDANWNMYCKPY